MCVVFVHALHVFYTRDSMQKAVGLLHSVNLMEMLLILFPCNILNYKLNLLSGSLVVINAIKY